MRAIVDRHYGDLRRAAKQMDEPSPTSAAEEASPESAIPPVTAMQRLGQDAYARRHDRYQEDDNFRESGRSVHRTG